MPKKYENKSNHNKLFLNSISQDYPHEYFDWKVTVQFYYSLHLCYCTLLVKGIDILTSHNGNIKNIKSFDETLSKKLFRLYRNSKQSRYEGFLSEDAMLRINKINFVEGVSLIKSVESACLKYYPPKVA